jgi:hypothetical protein
MGPLSRRPRRCPGTDAADLAVRSPTVLMFSRRGARPKRTPRLETRDQPRRGQGKGVVCTPLDALAGRGIWWAPLHAPAEGGGHGYNSVGYPTVPRRGPDRLCHFSRSFPSTRFARRAGAGKHAPTRTVHRRPRDVSAGKVPSAGMDRGIQPDIRFAGLRTNTPSAIPPVNVVSPEPRRSPSRGSLSACSSLRSGPRGGRENASGTEKAPPGRGSVNRVWGSSLPRAFIVQARMSELGRRPRLSTCGGTRDAHPAFSLRSKDRGR